MLGFSFILTAILTAVLALSVAGMRARERGAWGQDPATGQLRAVPRRVRWTNAMALTWGLVTLLFWVPMGVLGSFLALGITLEGEAGFLQTFVGTGLGLGGMALVLSGLPSAIFMVASAFRLQRAETRNVREWAHWLRIHHLMVGGVSLFYPPLLLMTGVPVLIGLAIAQRLQHGANQADEIPAAQAL